MGPILFWTNQILMPLFTNNSTGKQVEAIQVDASQPNVAETIFEWVRTKTTSTIKILKIIDSVDFVRGYVTYYELYIDNMCFSVYVEDYVFFDQMSKMVLVMPSARFEKEFAPVEESIITRAENLISRHVDGWTPNPSDWNMIRDALREGRIALDEIMALKAN
jgi:hypothetical protein